jgi:hypothetical protein
MALLATDVKPGVVAFFKAANLNRHPDIVWRAWRTGRASICSKGSSIGRWLGITATLETLAAAER